MNFKILFSQELFSESELRDGTRTFQELNFSLLLVKFKKLGVSVQFLEK